jgi:hypothetical protein
VSHTAGVASSRLVEEDSRSRTVSVSTGAVMMGNRSPDTNGKTVLEYLRTSCRWHFELLPMAALGNSR